MRTFTQVLLILAYAVIGGVCAHTLFGVNDAGVYHIAPDNKTIEYRNAFSREYTDVEREHRDYAFRGERQGYPAFSVDTTKARLLQKVRHYPAGLYYKNSDVQYAIPMGKNIIYSLVKSPSGNVQRLVVWRILQSKMTQKRINRDCVEVNDTWVAKTSLCGLFGVLFEGFFGWSASNFNNNHAAAWALTGLIDYAIVGGYSNSGEKHWVDFEYMTDKSRNLLLQKMIAAGDKRAEWVQQNTSLLVVDVLEVRVAQQGGIAHIEHFTIKPAMHDDVAKTQESNHGKQGSIAYDLLDKDHRVIKYAMTNDEHGLTLMERFKHVFGWR